MKSPNHLANTNTAKAKDWRSKHTKEKGEEGDQHMDEIAQGKSFNSILETDYKSMIHSLPPFILPANWILGLRGD